MPDNFLQHIAKTLAEIEADGLYKREREIAGQQQGRIEIADGQGGKRPILNLCANNYLGLANHPEIIAAGKRALDDYGFGMASVRFICGTQTQHRALEKTIAAYLGKDDSILFAACFDANGSVFETLLTDQDAVISDGLNHASIIDGIRLCKAKRYRFPNGDMNALEEQLKQAEADGARFKLIVTDGVFSMDGFVADLKTICDLADRHDALVMVDDCHATGHLGEQGKGTPALTGAGDRVDIISGTLGKTLGGALGGFIAAKQPIIDLLRQRARAYLFSNSLPPAAVAGAIKAVEIAKAADDRREKLMRNTRRFRDGLKAAGFDLLEGTTPIVPVMLGEAKLAQSMAAELDSRGVYVAGFFFPVVPKGKARIRTQLSAVLEDEDIDFAVDAFREAGKATGAI
ncbi:glycine C-acetyltransferase [Limoniibacter endophyticus]|uniref:2-amino-3-ketobutyrate coenzyme A ligase n=1 Tax=Limoniibacter endophyticus TaxID=1565040 RepID=A0A8J3GG25_9HYPH|nr:glycine C-acetyltransferase [Limoniibacter endophyticus]GHC66385.1 2-amino-3-ketobutyrate coenzyme A ligase [Limoniibacter endophyticus]